MHDTVTRTSALRAGTIDLMDQPDLKTAHLLGKTLGIQVVSVTGLRHFTIPMFTDVAPYDNNDVRLALKYAIDREELLQKILAGQGALGNDHPVAPSMRF